MSKALYLGVNGVAHKGKKAYIGVSGVAHKIKKMYVGDANGKARLCWSGEKVYETLLTVPLMSGGITTRSTNLQNPTRESFDTAVNISGYTTDYGSPCTIYNKVKKLFVIYLTGNRLYGSYKFYTRPLGSSTWTTRTVTFSEYVNIANCRMYVDESGVMHCTGVVGSSSSSVDVRHYRFEINDQTGNISVTSTQFTNSTNFSRGHSFTKVNGLYFLAIFGSPNKGFYIPSLDSTTLTAVNNIQYMLTNNTDGIDLLIDYYNGYWYGLIGTALYSGSTPGNLAWVGGPSGTMCNYQKGVFIRDHVLYCATREAGGTSSSNEATFSYDLKASSPSWVRRSGSIITAPSGYSVSQTSEKIYISNCYYHNSLAANNVDVVYSSDGSTWTYLNGLITRQTTPVFIAATIEE